MELEIAAQQRERDRLGAEQRAVWLEARGKASEAAFVRQEAALRSEESLLRVERKELDLERLQTVEPLQVEKRDLDLRREELSSGRRQLFEAPEDGSGDELEALEGRSLELGERIQDAQYDLRHRQRVIDGELTTLRYRRYELRYQKAQEEGAAEAAKRSVQERDRALRRRTEIEVAAVFDEVDAELRHAVREQQRIRRQTPPGASAHLQANQELRRLLEERQRLSMTRQTYREEAQLVRVESDLGRHLEKLERARLSASASEATELEAEIARLRAALTRLVSLAARGEAVP